MPPGFPKGYLFGAGIIHVFVCLFVCLLVCVFIKSYLFGYIYTQTDQQLKGRTWGMGVVRRPSQPRQLGAKRTGRLLYRKNARIPAASNKKGLAWLRERGDGEGGGLGGFEPRPRSYQDLAAFTGGCAFWGGNVDGTDGLTKKRPATAASGQRPVGVGRLPVEGLQAQGLQGYIDETFKNSPMSNLEKWNGRVGAQTAQTARVRAQTARRASDRRFDLRDPKLYLPLEQQVLNPKPQTVNPKP